MTEKQVCELIQIFKDMQRDISDMKTEMRRQKNELEEIKYILKMGLSQ